MDHNDLERPLSARGEKTTAGRGRFDGVVALASLVGGVLAAVGLWALLVDDPLGGEPVATAAIERRAAPRLAENAPTPAEPSRAHGQREVVQDASPEASRDGVPIVNPGDPLPKSGPVIIRVPGADSTPASGPAEAPGKPGGAVETAMLEDSRYGALPRIAADGRRPQNVYARRQPDVAGPRVALVVGGLGVGKAATATALKALPAEVTLAFAPYGADVGALVADARKNGHEVLLQAPMEPFAYPQNDPGPQTLLTSLPASANLERLRWALGRAAGYVGIAPLAGARFLETEESLQPVFTELARRGLMFVAQGSRDSRVGALADRSGLVFARAAAPVDASLDAAAIDAALADLEHDAKNEGAAVGWAGATPLTLQRIEAWRGGLSARGVTLVPLTAALKSQGPS